MTLGIMSESACTFSVCSTARTIRHSMGISPVENDWKDLERLVQLIEMSISAGSSVAHNVELPILRSRSGTSAQCDIVIRTGKPPRETVSIVEVQNRGSKVKPNDFRGWKQKLQDVGAQHLICVSRQPFPASIKEQAQLSGGSVRLVTLSTLEVDDIPLDMFRVHFQYHHFEVAALHGFKATASKSDVPTRARCWFSTHHSLGVNDRVFSLDRVNLCSAYILCRDMYVKPHGSTSGRGKLVFERDKEPILYLHHGEDSFRVGLEYEFDWTDEVVDIPVSTLAYEQNDAGALAWVVEASYDSPKGRIAFKIPTSRVEGGYSIPGVMTELPPDTVLDVEFLPPRDEEA